MLNPQSSERSGGTSAVPQHLARYEILRELGRGGMAVVYLALDPAVKRQVALKVLPRQFTFDPQFRDRFHREAEAIAGLEHPAITPIYDYGEVDDQPFIVMRFMTGGSLADRMAAAPIPLPEISKVFSRVASALDAAHQRGMVHRDLKPSNILFDQWGEAYLSDFGIVKLAESSATFTGSMVLGTPAYMSPEQANGKGVDGRSDIYSLAVVLFELLTHQLPYQADTPMGLAMAHILQPVPDIHAVDPKLPPASSVIIRKALAKDPKDRYPTAGAIAAAVAQLANGSWAGPAAPLAVRPKQESPVPNPQSEASCVVSDFRPRSVAVEEGRKGLSLPARLGLSIGSGLAAFVVMAGLCLGAAWAANQLWIVPTPTPAEAQVFVPSSTQTATSTATKTATPTFTATATSTDVPSATATLTPTRTRRPLTSTPTETPLPTSTPLPQCNPPEFFDPLMNRCRMPDSPQADQPSSGGSGDGGGAPPSDGGGGPTPIPCPFCLPPPIPTLPCLWCP